MIASARLLLHPQKPSVRSEAPGHSSFATAFRNNITCSRSWALSSPRRPILLLRQSAPQSVCDGHRWWKLWKRDVREGWEILGRYRVSQCLHACPCTWRINFGLTLRIVPLSPNWTIDLHAYVAQEVVAHGPEHFRWCSRAPSTY